MYRRTAAFALLSLSLIGCGALKDALTSHADVVARAGSQQLSSQKLADMMAAAQMPPRKDLAAAVANIWVNYQLLGQAGARADTVTSTKDVDDAMWAQIVQSKLRKFQVELQKGFKAPDAAGLQKAFDDGEMLAARHILIMADRNVLKPNQIDSAKRVADNIRRQVTPANFVAMVKRHSGDPGSKDTGGEYFWPTPQIPQMVPEFEQGTRALKPGEISQPIQTNFGFHIILRETYAEAKVKFDSAYQQVAKLKAESTYFAGMDNAAKVEVKEGAAKTVKAIAEDLDAYRDNRTVVASSNSYDLRASRVALWIAAFPSQMQLRRNLAQAPDSLLPDFLKNLMRNELMLKAADSAKVTVDSAELAQIRGAFRLSVQSAMGGLGLLPAQLADSAKSNADREKLAAARVDAYMAKLLKNEAQFVDVSEPVSLALRRKYDAKVTIAGIDRAVTLATEAKAKADSAANASMPATEVPMPGAAGPPPATSSPAAPAKAPDAKKP